MDLKKKSTQKEEKMSEEQKNENVDGKKQNLTDEEIKEIIENASKKITNEDLEKVIKQEEKLNEKIKKGLLSKYVEDIKLLFLLVKDFFAGKYKKVRWSTITAIVVALLYIINPFDLIPDFIPFFGYIDDLAVLKVCSMMVKVDIDKYKEWRNQG